MKSHVTPIQATMKFWRAIYIAPSYEEALYDCIQVIMGEHLSRVKSRVTNEIDGKGRSLMENKVMVMVLMMVVVVMIVMTMMMMMMMTMRRKRRML